MHPLKSNGVAWSVAVASLALWAMSAPVSWSAALNGSVRLLDQSADSTADTPSPDSTDVATGDTASLTSDVTSQTGPCPTLPTAIAQLIPPLPTPVPAASAAAPSASEGAFHICGSDPQAEQAIGQLIAGRGFSAMLSARGDGCADLTIRATSGLVSGSSSSNLSVSLGSGRNLRVQIVSAQGTTRASVVAQ